MLVPLGGATFSFQLSAFSARAPASPTKPLHFLAAVFDEEAELFVGLHAFGGDGEVEAVGHGDDGGDDGAVAAAGLDGGASRRSGCKKSRDGVAALRAYTFSSA
jgi:hypothetical protein